MKLFTKLLLSSLTLSLASAASLNLQKDQLQLREETITLSKRFDNATIVYFLALGNSTCGTTMELNDFIVSINSEQYEGGSRCLEYVTVSYEGMSSTGQIVNECTTCPPYGLALSPGMWSSFGLSTEPSVIYGDWVFDS
ncbi:hypothetical protein SERLA73DRAFT_158400 [Serpula lacrymans var. lacrymans S7.3]|uniref:Uncharacterized protein n=2 Tax=Serpula lacrymans var. lacrymans TaxID=341189 RepID=F8PL91_SERL3|nr:uncharacterized protein SERLADRAFT_433861 [Serpula lacrymans var. lacrymans S7.9]EGO03999.1 hypothetical protein SERLA73DRAFT_158400 [Serpula lacrymans var. lacrymans S7.3]EGO29918.1 hypothetical protein SERLADRAFT_433861 [Serpula lacrymans var. lacrymans S7.9]